MLQAGRLLVTVERPSKDNGQVVRDREGHAFRLARIHCPTCGPSTEKVLGVRGGPSQRHGLGVPTPIVECQSCGLLYPNPFPFPLDSQTLYGDPEKYFAAHDLDRKVERYRSLARELARRTGRPDPRVLDIGAGRGDFLEAARREGITDTLGIEFSGAMIEFARASFGVTLVAETATELLERGVPPFHAIVLNAVLEHVHDPNELVRTTAGLLERGGIVYIDVPREPHLLALVGRTFDRIRGRSDPFSLQPTWPPYHVFGFNPRALRKLLSKHGLAIDSLVVRADPHLESDGTPKDRVKVFVAEHVNRLANRTGLAANMYVWASKR
ncbi:MAG: class I SAM-dependent methyltransferase [Deltaproteobacteria bacterium]|nr:class I SAM-dependent methyltransferase [Deltaproteobacteria bacterium]